MKFKISDQVMCKKVVKPFGAAEWLPGTVVKVNPSQKAYQVKLNCENDSTPGWFFHTEVKVK